MSKRARCTIKEKGQPGNGKHPSSPLSLGIIGACGIVIVLITFVLYTPALKNDFVNWDDNEYVCENSYICSLNIQALLLMLTAFLMGNWHPLTLLSHAIDYAIWELNPFGHHLISIILHGLNTLLVFLLVTQLMLIAHRNASASISSPLFHSTSVQSLIAAGVTALLFGIHPVHVESVAWVSERKDLLCAFFFLLTLCSYLFYTSSAAARNRRVWFATSMVLALAALMAKPMAVTLPLVLLLLDCWPLKRITIAEGTHRNLRVVLEKVPFVLLSCISSILTILAQHAAKALITLENIPMHFRLLNALHSLFFYLTKMLWPAELVPFYPLPKTVSIFDLTYSIPVILGLSITGGCIWLWRRGRPLFLTIWAYYLIMLLPVVGIIQVGGQAAADRYTYLPSISIFLLAGMGGAQLYAIFVRRKKIVIPGGTIAVLIFILFGQLTVKQITVWRDSETLWRYVVKSFPGRVHFAHHNLGNIYYERGMFYEAIAEYENALAIYPDYAETHNNLGNAYYTTGNYSDAAYQFDKALVLGYKVDPDVLEFVKHNQPYF